MEVQFVCSGDCSRPVMMQGNVRNWLHENGLTGHVCTEGQCRTTSPPGATNPNQSTASPVFLNLSQLAGAAKQDNQAAVVLNMAGQPGGTACTGQPCPRCGRCLYIEGSNDNFTAAAEGEGGSETRGSGSQA